MARSKTKTLQELSTAWETHTQVWVPLEVLAAALLPGNPKDHDHGQMVSSFKEFGVIDIPSYNLETGHLIGGNGRTETAMSLKANGEGLPEGLQEIDGSWCMPVWVTRVSQEREMAAAIALNRTGELGGWHADLLTSELASIAASEWGLEGTGYDPEDLDRLIADLAELGGGNGAGNTAEDPGPQVDRAEELQAKWGTELGQLWEVGKHRIVCGDCTDRAVVERVMGGERGEMGMTSPPYGVGRDYEKKGIKAWFKTMIPAVKNLVDFCELICWNIGNLSATGSQMEEPSWVHSTNLFRAEGWVTAWTRIWRKDATWASSAPYWTVSYKPVSEFEFIGCFSIPGLKYKNRLTDEERREWGFHGIWDIPSVRLNDIHCAMYPIDLPERCIRMMSDSGETVLDPFLGSGTTLVACERLGRLGRGIEIEPKYVSVALQRLSDMGLEPRRIEE